MVGLTKVCPNKIKKCEILLISTSNLQLCGLNPIHIACYEALVSTFNNNIFQEALQDVY